VIELAAYAVLVIGYFFLVLHFLSGWLQELHLHHVKVYALVAIVLIIGQAVLARKCYDVALPPYPGRSG